MASSGSKGIIDSDNISEECDENGWFVNLEELDGMMDTDHEQTHHEDDIHREGYTSIDNYKT